MNFYKEALDFNKDRKKFSDLKILVIGDIMVDHYIYGDAKRISPEAPVPIVLKNSEKFYLGGAGNVFLNIRSLGGNSDIFSVVGNDNSSSIISQILSDLGTTKKTTGSVIFTDPKRKTTTKTRVIAGNQQIVRIDDETTFNIDEKLENYVISSFEAVISEYDGILIEDYNKGFLTPRIISKIIKKANQLKIPVIIDPKKENTLYYKGATIIKPNFSEFCDLIGKNLDPSDFESISEEADSFRNKMDLVALVVTMSDKGIFFSSNQVSFFGEGFKVNVSDVSGAGDTVVSMLTLCYLSGMDYESTINLCNVAGAIACSQNGAINVTLDEISKHPEIIRKYNKIKEVVNYLM